jgi:epoxyqueuosine reductase
MPSASTDIAALIDSTIGEAASGASGVTQYRDPVVGFVRADDPRFLDLRRLVHPDLLLPEDVLPGARAVVSFFLPFATSVVDANARSRSDVAEEWAIAYVETNALIDRVGARLVERLQERGVRAAARPPTGDFKGDALVGRWSHKSAAVIAGIGSFGVHQMVITDAGCAGRFGTLVVDRELPARLRAPLERCAHFREGGCLACVALCPIGALRADRPMHKDRCWARCQLAGTAFARFGRAEVCGKCAAGACAVGVPPAAVRSE